MKLIVSKEEAVTNAMTREKNFVCLGVSVCHRDEMTGVITYFLCSFALKDGVLHEIPGPMIQAKYKKDLWLSKFGHLTVAEFEEQTPKLMIAEIGLNKNNYWGLDSSEWEVLKIN